MSKEFIIEYHGCGACFYDGTVPLITKSEGCDKPTTFPFWKEPKDVNSSPLTRLQLKTAKKHLVQKSYSAEYKKLLSDRMAKHLNKVVAEHFNSDSSDSDNSDGD